MLIQRVESAEVGALLFHGLTGSTDEIIDLANHLHKTGISVVVPTLSGHSDSIEVLRKTRTGEWLQDADKAWQALMLEPLKTRVIIGLSFGSLLAMHLAAMHPAKVSALVLISVPYSFVSSKLNFIVPLLSLLPEIILDTLGCVKKSPRKEGVFIRERVAFPVHSVGAVARLWKIRKLVDSKISDISAPVLLLQDPEDHHVSEKVPAILKVKLVHAAVEERLFPGGQHQLTIGQSHTEVESEVLGFIERTRHKASPKELLQ